MFESVRCLKLCFKMALTLQSTSHAKISCGQTDGRTDGPIGRMGGWADGQTNGGMDGWMDEQTDGWMDEWKIEFQWMDKRTDGWTDG